MIFILPLLPNFKEKTMKKKKIMITGAGSGLGKGTAIGLAKEGHTVIAATHTWEQMSRFIEETKERQQLEGAGRPGFLYQFNEAKYFDLKQKGITFEV